MSTLGTETLAEDIWGSLFYYKDTGANKHHFGILPLVSGPSPAPPNSLKSPVLGASGQATNWVGTQPHPPADRLP